MTPSFPPDHAARSRFRLLALFAVLALTFSTSPLHAAWRRLAPGVQFQEFSPDPPITYHVAKVSLREEPVHIVATRESDRGKTVSRFAASSKALVAINGDYFDQSMAPTGPTLSACGPWTKKAASKRNQPVLVVGPSRAEIFPFADIPSALPSWAESAISGWPLLVKGCRALPASELPGSDAFTRSPHARTAVGLSADKKTLFMVVVDGRKGDKGAGVTLADLGEFMKSELGVCTALNLDGGGSSTMVVKGKLASKPSSGSERIVANHLGVAISKAYLSCPEPPAATSIASKAPKKPVMPTADIWRDIDEILGEGGRALTGEVYRISLPRRGMNVRVTGEENPDGVLVRPSLALTSVIAFRRTEDEVMMLADLVVSDDEITGVTESLKDGGITETSRHPIFPDQSTPFKLHVAGKGSASTLAHALRKALDRLGPTEDATADESAAIWPDGATARIAEILGRPGTSVDQVEQFSFPRKERITSKGRSVPSTVAVSTVNFQSIPDDKVIVAGELLLLPSEVDRLRADLEQGGFDLGTSHERVPATQPRILSVAFWAVGDAAELAEVLRGAIRRTNHAAPDVGGDGNR